MPAFLVAVVLAAIYLFIKSYWMWLLVAVGVLSAVGVASWLALNYQIRKEAREAERKETQRLEDLRNEPLADGETVEDRIQKRYLETCSTYFNEVAGVHYQGGMQWRGRLREITRQHLRPALSPEQWTVASDIVLRHIRLTTAPLKSLSFQRDGFTCVWLFLHIPLLKYRSDVKYP